MSAVARAAAAVLGVGLLLALTAPGPAFAASTDPGAVDRFLVGSLDRTGIPGVAVAWTRGGDVVEARGIGSAGGGRPVSARTRFRVASLSKSFTAVAVLRLVDAGRVHLDDPIHTYLPRLHPSGPGADRITVRQLLTQSSGLSDAGYPGLTGDQPADPAGRVDSLRAAHTVAEPGTEYHYFDPNYQVLARLVEVLTGRTFPDALHDIVVAPLGMTDTNTVVRAGEAERLPDIADGHVLLYGHAVPTSEQDGLLAGSGGVVTTASDMARWLAFQSTDRPALLSPSTFALMHTPAGPAGNAMGWFRDPTGRLQHDGVLSTFFAQQVLLPDGQAFALLYDANAQLADVAGVQDGVAALLDGRDAAPVRPTAPVAYGIAALTVLTLGLRVWQLRRVPAWRARHIGRAWSRRALGIVAPVGWLLVLVALPTLLLWGIDRRFTLGQLAMAMPEIVVLLAVTGLSGLVLAALRVRRSGRGRPAADRASGRD